MEKGFFGQGSGEFIMLLAAMLTVALVSISLLMFFPNMAAESQLQKSQSFWADGRPFSVQGNTIYTTGMLLQMQNSEPVTMTITGISINGVPLNLYNHSLPFTWTRTNACNSPGDCSILVYPGQTAAISTDEFDASPQNPCGTDDSFADGKIYSVNFSISYKTNGQSFTQSGTTQLMGKCTKGDQGYCGGAVYSMGSQLCCDDSYTCNKGTQACGAGSCVVACNGEIYNEATLGCCANSFTYNTASESCCTDVGSYKCTNPQVCNAGTCGLTCGSGKYNPATQQCCPGNYICGSAYTCSGGICKLPCGSGFYDQNSQQCCTDTTPNYICGSSQACFTGQCANYCGSTPYVSPTACCANSFTYNSLTERCCTDVGSYKCTSSQTCNSGACGLVCGSSQYNPATQQCCTDKNPNYVCSTSQICSAGQCGTMLTCGPSKQYNSATEKCCSDGPGTKQYYVCTKAQTCNVGACGGIIDIDDI